MPIHWNIHGKVDGYAGKTFGALFLPALNALVVILLAFLPRLDPKCQSYDAETRASVVGVFRVCRLAGSLFLSALAIAIFFAALKFQFDMTLFIIGGMGLMLMVIGNSMGKLRPNWFAGFRTPWSLESRTVWIKTHRLGGRLMVGSGLLLFVASLFLPPKLCFLLGVVPMIILVVIVPLTYSYFSFRAEKNASHVSSH